jgi:hypothetical protein
MSHLASPCASEDAHHHIALSDLTPDLYKTYSMASARLYHTPFTADGHDWTYSKLRGKLVFGRDRSVPTAETASTVQVDHGACDTDKFWFRLVDGVSGKTVWMFRVPAILNYQQELPFFHVFHGKVRFWCSVLNPPTYALAEP